MEKQPDSGQKYLSKTHFFAGSIERFTQITKWHIRYLLSHNNASLKKIIESLDNEAGLPAEVLLARDEFTEIGLKEETKLFKDFRAGKNSDHKELLKKRNEAITKLIKAHKPVFEKIALKLDPTGSHTDDLVQIGLINFIESLDSENYEKKSRLIKFVLRIAYYQMERYLYQNRQILSISIPRSQKLSKLEYIIRKSDENITLDELINTICKELETTEKKALDLLNLYYNRDYETQLDSLQDPADLQDTGIERTDLQNRLNEVLKRLTPKMESVVRLRTGYLPDSYTPTGLKPNSESLGKQYDDELTLLEIGKIFGVTKSRTGQIMKKSILKLQKPENTKDLEEFVPWEKVKKETKKPQPEEIKFKSEAENVEFLRINDNGIIILKIDGKEIEAITRKQYEKHFKISTHEFTTCLQKTNIRPIDGIKITFVKRGKASYLYRKDELDKAVANTIFKKLA